MFTRPRAGSDGRNASTTILVASRRDNAPESLPRSTISASAKTEQHVAFFQLQNRQQSPPIVCTVRPAPRYAVTSIQPPFAFSVIIIPHAWRWPSPQDRPVTVDGLRHICHVTRSSTRSTVAAAAAGHSHRQRAKAASGSRSRTSSRQESGAKYRHRQRFRATPSPTLSCRPSCRRMNKITPNGWEIEHRSRIVQATARRCTKCAALRQPPGLPG